MEVAGARIPDDVAELLGRFHFERVPFEQLRARYLAAAPDAEALHRIGEPIEVPADDVAQPLPAPGTPERDALVGARRGHRSSAARSPPSCSRAAWPPASARRSRRSRRCSTGTTSASSTSSSPTSRASASTSR